MLALNTEYYARGGVSSKTIYIIFVHAVRRTSEKRTSEFDRNARGRNPIRV